jgi:hypothetical protein
MEINRPAILLEAQFYTTERYRRVDEKAQDQRDRVASISV